MVLAGNLLAIHKTPKEPQKQKMPKPPPCKNNEIAEFGERVSGYNKRDTSKFLHVRGWIYTQNIHIICMYVLYTQFIHIFHTHNLYTQPLKDRVQSACWE